MKRLVEDEFVAKKFVVVADVPVAVVKVKFWRDEEADTIMPCTFPLTLVGKMNPSFKLVCCQGTVVTAKALTGRSNAMRDIKSFFILCWRKYVVSGSNR